MSHSITTTPPFNTAESEATEEVIIPPRTVDNLLRWAKQQEDPKLALAAYKVAASCGDAAAQYAVGTYLEHGVGTKKDLRAAVQCYRLAADRNVDALYSLARCFSEGRGVRRDPQKAVKLFQHGAGKGDLESQYALGLAYMQGRGIGRDYEKGMKWLMRAAERGFAPAQFSVGLSYSRGHGVPRDLDEAKKWYRLAAEQGEADAQENLASAAMSST